MDLATTCRPNDLAVSAEARSETVARAEEALRRAMHWADWMEAAEKARHDYDDTAHPSVAEPDEGWMA